MEELDWDIISCDLSKDEKFYMDNKKFIDIDFVLMTHRFSEKYIEDNMDIFNENTWKFIFKYQILSMNFINKYHSKLTDLSFSDISKYQKLSKEFIIKNADKLNWRYIGLYQVLDDELMDKFKDLIRYERPNIVFNRDIKQHGPNGEFIANYKFDKDKEITWNDFVENCNNTNHITWMNILVKRNKKR